VKQAAMNILGLVLGFVVGTLATEPLYAQGVSSHNVVVNKDFTICQDVTVATLAEAQALPVSLTVDNQVRTVTPTWAPTPGSSTQFRVEIPLKQLPAAQQALGRHDFSLSVGGYLLADGSYTNPTVTSDYYVVVADTGPTVGPIQWIRIAGLVALALGGIWHWLLR
jgi:hypothetical protein